MSQPEQDMIMALYAQLAKIFYWTPSEVDEQEAEVIFGIMNALPNDKPLPEKTAYIDQVF